jgi:hypothetical protein
MHGSNTIDPHEARNTMLAARFTSFSKIKKDPGRTVDAVARYKRRADEAKQSCVLLRSV